MSAETGPAASRGGTMQAVTQHGYGDSGVLGLEEVPRPGIRPDQVLVRVHAAGLDRGTEHLVTGRPYAVRLVVGLRRPRNPVLGRDVAGTVATVGCAVTRFAPSDEVYGVAPGSFAEYPAADEDKLAVKPTNLSFAEAAVVPIPAGADGTRRYDLVLDIAGEPAPASAAARADPSRDSRLRRG